MAATTDTLIDEIVAYYDNTNSTVYQNDTVRRARILHYLNMVADDFWYYRCWPFTLKSASLICVNGQANLPSDFARIGEGAVLDNKGTTWTEITYQDIVVNRAQTFNSQKRWFALSNKFWVVNPVDARTFTMIYQSLVPEFADGDPIAPFPDSFSHALLTATAALLMRMEGETRKDLDMDVLQMKSFLVKLHMPLRSRPMQMPVTVGGKW